MTLNVKVESNNLDILYKPLDMKAVCYWSLI
jgi:hypothetical protein